MSKFEAFIVRRDTTGEIVTAVEPLALDDLPAGEVVIAVEYSSLNYKDALACRGHAGVVGKLPHVPGIDCAGRVAESSDPRYAVGQPVLVTGYKLGAEEWGGYSQYVRVPAEWVVPMPPGLTARSAMIYGTAGFTAAQCVSAIVDRGIEPSGGTVLVTGSTGGVGILAVAILAKLGYQVAAVTGKAEQHALLKQLGVTEILARSEVVDTTTKALLPSRFAAAVDTVGGATLATVVRSLNYRGIVAACGLVGGADLPLSVYPFLLRGVTLAGIDSAKCPRAPREEMWRRLSGEWRVELPAAAVSEVTLEELPSAVEKILAGKIVGRTLVRL